VTSTAEINARDRTVTIQDSGLTEALTQQAQWKATGVLELLLRERDRRRRGAIQVCTITELLAVREQTPCDADSTTH
jgi:hypothetical protein